MWNRIKRWFGVSERAPDNPAETETGHGFKWYEPGDDNPFGVRFLDVRGFTWNVIATTSDPHIATTFGAQRQTLGREFVSAKIDDAQTIACSLSFPHNGDRLEGIVFKADCMEVKWDIYIYDSTFLFVRSWTGQLEYRAFAEVGQDRIVIHTIEASAGNIDLAPQTVYFVLGTHAMRRVLPHAIPASTPDDPQVIAQLSFALFGNRACYATFDDITQVPILRPETK